MANKQLTISELEEKIRSISPIDLAYIAGIVDGEGYIGLINQESGKRRIALRLTVVMNNHAVMRWLCKTTGLGALKREPRHIRGNRQESYRWQVTCRQAAHLLMALYPFLKVKRQQAEIAGSPGPAG